MKFHILTLGCPKNEVDSEGMEVLLMEAGHSPVVPISEADLVIVNTCGFIDAARDESLEALRRIAARKRRGSFLVAAGCLAQREGEALSRRVPGMDAVLGCRSWPEIARIVDLVASSPRRGAPIPVLAGEDLQLGEVRRKPPAGSAYLKISDGCDAFCSFCAIPAIKGPYRSKPRAGVLAEVRQLVEGGAREVVLVGQDTTAYGLDRGERDGLSQLLEEIVDAVPDLPWLRVLYLYPQRITPRLLRLFGELPRLCRYFDIPLQHTHPEMLRRMGRPSGDVGELVAAIREAVPDAAIRTTFIVGFPGETGEEHDHLLRTMERVKFDRVGVFEYSPQAGTRAASLPRQVSARVKRRRWRQAMETARAISLERNRALVGRELEVLVEGVQTDAGGRAPVVVGRSYRDAPEVDGLVLLSGDALPGEMVRVAITTALDYDLLGKMVGRQGDAEIEGRGDAEMEMRRRGEGRWREERKSA